MYLVINRYLQKNEETVFAARPGYNTDGKPIQMSLNIFAVNSFANRDIYQYDVSQ